MKIALIALYNHNAFNIRILHAALKSKNYEARSFFLKKNLALEGKNSEITDIEYSILIEALKEFAPSVVGINVISTFFHHAAELTARIKEQMNALVIWGGIHPNLCPDDCINHADVICMGEGEEAIVELADRIEKKQDYTNINNLWIKKDSGVIKNELTPYKQDLNSIPFPDFSDTPIDKYYIVNNEISHRRPGSLNYYPIMTTRGCMFNCTYCSATVVKRIYPCPDGYFRRKNVKNVIDELLTAKKNIRKLKRIHFYDSIFPSDEAWIREFCEEYKQKINLPFLCYFNPRTARDKIIFMLKDAGLRHVRVGIQSGSCRIRNKMYNRPESKEDIMRFAQIMKKTGLAVCYELIVGNPMEPVEDKSESLNLLLELPKPFKVFAHILCFYPGSDITVMALKERKIRENNIVGRQKRIFYQGMLPLDAGRDKETIFWSFLYYLTGKRYFPNTIIRLLRRCKLLEKQPLPAAAILDKAHRIYACLLTLFEKI
ncbi:B12-binding domain-containing radical SAM protein [Elusimicrobiota bacterium]